MYRCKWIASVLFLLFAVSGNAHAADAAEAATEQVRARLVASVDSVHAGDEITVGVNQRIIPHWHTYWINPGDSGMATSIDWTLPAGAEAGDIQWPIPHRFTTGPITNYGYSDEVTLLTNIRVPTSLKPGDTFPVKALVNWLVCDDVCIPQEVKLTLSLPVVAGGADGGKGSELIAKARQQLPLASPWQVSAYGQKQGPLLKVAGKVLEPGSKAEVWFFPEEWGRVSHKSKQPRRIDPDALLLQLSAGDNPLVEGEQLKGVLVVSKQTRNGTLAQGYQLDVKLEPGIAESISDQEAVPIDGAGISAGEDISFYSALLFALLGGIILNLMPCVFPVLSIKALSLLNHSKQSQSQTRRHGWAYTGGVLASFTLLGVALIVLKSAGGQVGWGFQFQSPIFVVLVAYLMFAVGLSLSGVLTIGSSFAGVGSSLAEKPGYSGSFFTGVLATVVATPCTAPFMGGALGYALTQPAVVLLAVFLSLGLGLALPYLLLSHWPSLQRFLPKPGIWMERFKQVLAFPMYAAAVWLVWVLAQQAGPNAVALALAGMVLIALLAWIYEITRHSGNKARHAANTFSALGLLAVLYGSYSGIQLFAGAGATSAASAGAVTERNWEAYSEQRLDDLRSQGKPVFINLTAAWCITCLVNEQVALSQRSVVEAFSKSGVTYLKGDWTNQDQQITQLLKQFGRSGVPLYILYPASKDAKPQVLPQILTPEIVLNAVQKL
ncbi:thioredoxin family protein [Methylobacillus caricis]|uniref:protein-disulfide reductase DsbD family protein n=1 Tax=Methylobacillus caricis TaxID=1971611 RepID=UPI001CFFBE2C|nr:protein-disulfide reductase DsbD domain-containing protein [Methylobacillus caricis]MCB5188243.1 thioredoxin family protein [Methylobacillus caricis]